MQLENLSFLVVEDNEFQLRCLVRVLNEMGARSVYSAQDGQAALKLIDEVELPIDIVVCDVNMPGMDGLEFIRHWSERGDPSSLILMSAIEPELLATVANMALAYKVTLLGVAAKPATAAKLTPLIAQHLALQPRPTGPATEFSFREITQAWTDSEFECWFEPQVSLTSGVPRSLGAVPRWRHPERGVLEPGVFLPALQIRGLRDDFAWLHLQQSIAQCRRWQGKGGGPTVSVHLDFSSLADMNLAPRLLQMLQVEGVDPRSMVLTVDERALHCPELARVLENLARLRLLGFGLGIEDFGKGLMAVDRLSLASFTELRIPSSFVAGVDGSQARRAELAVALEAAQDLNVSAVAMGVATKDEWKLLHEWGCKSGQGPLIGAAMPAEEVTRWLSRWQSRNLIAA